MSFDAPLWLVLLPLAALPFVAPAGRALDGGALARLPRDAPSRVLDVGLRAASALALAAIVVALAGPYRPEAAVERIGQGAEIVIVLDRSRSMDQGFAGTATRVPAGTGPEALAHYVHQQHVRQREPKRRVAVQMLAEFAARRPRDRFGMVVFSNRPLRVLDFTSKPQIVQAAIAAGDAGRGLADTDIGLAMQAALEMFDGRPYAGSRVVLLVSDGGDHVSPEMRERIAELARRHRVGIDWIYIRSALSPGLADEAAAGAASDTVPEFFLHRFFRDIGVPYRAYEAEDPQALQAAIDDIDRLENLPLTYTDTLPRRDFAAWGYAAALAAALVLLAASLLERRRWA
ncbi:vWA domain-containing protein [Azohydromonas sediminis]|uniref:vWA domain-containing protein n=1 Tax=Azohydromonas sediminis TaxID=2259674 RepID=UPI000E64E480|nr:vWA domain-containing protein [Azohydromonas sediminis]